MDLQGCARVDGEKREKVGERAAAVGGGEVEAGGETSTGRLWMLPTCQRHWANQAPLIGPPAVCLPAYRRSSTVRPGPRCPLLVPTISGIPQSTFHIPPTPSTANIFLPTSSIQASCHRLHQTTAERGQHPLSLPHQLWLLTNLTVSPFSSCTTASLRLA